MNYPEPFLTELVQLGLHIQGFYDGKIDGISGPKTKAAFDAYVAKNRTARIQNYDAHAGCLSFGQGQDLQLFLINWGRNRGRYQAVANLANVPAPLIAALHWREAGGYTKPDLWGRYLHQGDPLGRPAVNIPAFPEVPVFREWEPAAVHALNMKSALRVRLGITAETRDINLLCEFAENYNGLGYRRKGLPSPYVLAGSTGYEKGKYVADGKFDPNAVDRQLGVLVMLRAAMA